MTSSDNATATTRAEAELRATATAWDQAMIANDADAIARFMADEWIIVGADGALTERTAFLNQIRDGRLRHDTMTTEEAHVRIYGAVGVLVARGVSAGVFDGRPFRVTERQSNVFVKHAGSWRCVLTHLSPSAPDDLRPDHEKSANARFAIKNWDEKPCAEGQGEPRLTRASVTKTYTGDIEAQAQVEYLMMYRGDGSAVFVGLERVVGRIGDKAGTFVLQRLGAFESGQAKESYHVIPESATGDLQGLRGEGSSIVGHGMEHPFTLNYELP